MRDEKLNITLSKQCLLISILLIAGLNLNLNTAYTDELINNHGSNIFHQIKIGLLVHDPDYLWSQQRKEDGLDLNFEIIFAKPSIEKLKGKLMPNFGVSINTSGDTSKLYGGIIWEHIFNQNIFLNL